MIGFILFVALLYGLLLLPWTQAKLTSFVSSIISNEIGLQVHISHITPTLWKTVFLHDITITNEFNDTVLTAKGCKATIDNIHLDSARVILQKVRFSDAHLSIIQDSAGIWNIDNFLKVVVYSKGSKSWKVGINEIELRGISVHVASLRTKEPDNQQGIDFDNIQLTRVNMNVFNFSKFKHSFAASISNFSCVEQSGFSIQYLQTDAVINDSSIICKNTMLFTPRTKFFSQHTAMYFKSFDDFDDFTQNVVMSSSIQYSQISFEDIAYFTSNAQHIPYNFTLSGSVAGRISNIRGKNIHIGFNASSRFIGSFELSGLPDISQTFMHIHADVLETNKHDIQRLRIPPYTQTVYVQLPSFLDKVETYSYTGNFTGFLNDFVAYGTLSTNIGTIYSDILISESSQTQSLYKYSGKITCKNLDLDKFPVHENTWGTLNASVEVTGMYDAKNILTAQVKGNISDLEFYNYTYHDITIDGMLAKQKFDGNIQIQDNNLNLSFHGLFDYSTETPSFNFNATVTYANLFALHLYDDTVSVVSLQTNVNFVGIQLDNLKGYIHIPYVQYTGKYGTYTSKQTSIDIDNINQTRNVTIRSDLFDLTINGKGSYKELPVFFYDFLHSHIPFLPKQNFTAKKTFVPSFNASLKIKKIDSLFQVLYPDIHIAQNTYINTVYSDESKLLVIQSHIPQFTYKDNTFTDISIQTNGTVDNILTNIVFDYDIFKKNSIGIHISNDSIQTIVSWSNTDEKRYEGSLHMVGAFAPSTHQFLPAIHLDVPKQSFYIADTLWNIYTSKIIIDSTEIYIPIGSFGKSNQRVTLEGYISENPHKVLQADFFNYNLENFNYIIDNKQVKIEGALEGRIEVKDVYHDMLLFANVVAPQFSFNGHKLGKLTAVSQWIPLQKAIAMNIGIQQGNTYIMQATGTYVPQNGKIDYMLNLQDLRLSIFKEIFEPTIRNVSGYVDGSIQATGVLSNPIFNGNIEIKRGKFRVDETKIAYTTKGTIQSQGSKLVFYDLPIMDSLTNVGLARGFVDFKKMNNPNYQIILETDKIMALHTTEIDNSSFYGDAFFQGTVTITGDLYNTSISAVGKTLENTRLHIPLSYSELNENKEFLQFQKSNTTQIQTVKTANSNGTELLLNIEVTPDALTQIIFDKQVGDIIKVKGSGNIQMNMDKQGNFYMYGDYTIESGDYLFTLKNLINKKFIIQQGGTITFNGDPFQAQIKVLAVYDLKAAPLPIMPIVQTSDSMTYKRRIPVQCNILLENNLMNPDISYNTTVASNYSQVQDVLNAMSTDDKNKQFLSLLLMNSFFSQSETQTLNSSASFEVLSNQLNNLLSQSSSNFDVGVNYRPGNMYSGNEFELALSTQLLNNRILVNVNGYSEFGQPADQSGKQTNEIAGDVTVEIKLNKQGNFRLKAFSRNNNDPIENRGNTQGISLFYTREFNSLREFFDRK
jgi:hypothetical protein